MKHKRQQNQFFGDLDGLEYEFETVRSFKIYFPLFNIASIILAFEEREATTD
jgi:hypothetical protein